MAKTRDGLCVGIGMPTKNLVLTSRTGTYLAQGHPSSLRPCTTQRLIVWADSVSMEWQGHSSRRLQDIVSAVIRQAGGGYWILPRRYRDRSGKTSWERQPLGKALTGGDRRERDVQLGKRQCGKWINMSGGNHLKLCYREAEISHPLLEGDLGMPRVLCPLPPSSLPVREIMSFLGEMKNSSSAIQRACLHGWVQKRTVSPRHG